MVIAQGDVFWVDFGKPIGSEPSGIRPAIVVQGDAFNKSDLRTVVVCGVTSSLRLGAAPGNVRLSKGEANLDRPSVANVSQLITVDRSWLRKKIGTLSTTHLDDVLDGIRLLISRPTSR